MSRINEMQRIQSVTGADVALVDTEERGTGCASFDTMAQFYKDVFLCGAVPYGKELTESWPALRARVQAGDFRGIHVGDYKTMQLANGETVVMEVSGIDQYYRCGNIEIGHHIDMISRDALAGTKLFNDTDDNNGTEQEKIRSERQKYSAQ